MLTLVPILQVVVKCSLLATVVIQFSQCLKGKMAKEKVKAKEKAKAKANQKIVVVLLIENHDSPHPPTYMRILTKPGDVKCSNVRSLDALGAAMWGLTRPRTASSVKLHSERHPMAVTKTKMVKLTAAI